MPQAELCGKAASGGAAAVASVGATRTGASVDDDGNVIVIWP